MVYLKNPMGIYEQPHSSFWQIENSIGGEPLRKHEYLFLYSNKVACNQPLVTMCCCCGKIRDLLGKWHDVEFDDTVTVSYAYCPTCFEVELEKLRQK